MNVGHCPLTPALKEILQTVWDLGVSTDKELAMALHRSPQTINREIKRMFELTGVHTRADLLVFAMKRGWIGLDKT